MWNISYTYLAKKLKSYILILLTKGCTKNHERFSSLVHDLWLSYFNILALMQFWCTGLISILKSPATPKKLIVPHKLLRSVYEPPGIFIWQNMVYVYAIFKSLSYESVWHFRAMLLYTTKCYLIDYCVLKWIFAMKILSET